MTKRRLYDLEDDSENLKELRRTKGSVGAAAGSPPPPPRPPREPSAGVPFAAYFAKYKVARRGYQLADVPELQPLVAVCDYLLVRADGFRFSLIAIVDRDARPEARFTLNVTQLWEIGRDCLAYTGTVNGKKVPVSISIYEIGGDGDATEAIDRLAPLRRGKLAPSVNMQAWLLDTETKRVWTNRPLAWLGIRLAMERFLRSPRLTEAELSTGTKTRGTGPAIKGQTSNPVPPSASRQKTVSFWFVIPALAIATLAGAVGVSVLLQRDPRGTIVPQPPQAVAPALPGCSDITVKNTLDTIMRRQILVAPINTLAMGYPTAYGYNLGTSEVSFEAFRNRGEANGVRTCLADVYADYAGPRLKASLMYTVELTDDRQLYVTVIEVGR